MNRIQLPRLDDMDDAEHDAAVDALVAALWAERCTGGPESDGESRKLPGLSDGSWHD